MPAVTTPGEEERQARERQRHMERMAREAQRARERRERETQRDRSAILRRERADAQARVTRAMREYTKALNAYGSCSKRREREFGNALDYAYNVAISAVMALRRIEAELRDCR